MKNLYLLALLVSGPASARDYFPVMDQMSYENGVFTASTPDGCRSRKLEIEIELRKPVRGPSPVSRSFEIWHQHVDVKVFTDESQSSCRMLSYSKIENFDLAKAVNKKISESEFQEQAMILIHLPPVSR